MTIANIDYPVFVSKESAMLIKKRTTREDKYLKSEVKLQLYQNVKKIKELEKTKYEEEGKLLVEGYDAKQVQKDLDSMQSEIEALEFNTR